MMWTTVSSKRKKPKSDNHGQYKFNKEYRLRISASLFDKPFPYFREPAECGSFSQDECRQFQYDRSQLRKFVPPPNWDKCVFDLSHGYANMIKKDESIKLYINEILLWIKHTRHTFFTHVTSQARQEAAPYVTGNLFESLNTDFVCWRGLLTRLLCIPYANREDVMIAIIRFRGTYFMCEFDTEAKKQEREEEGLMCAWGFKFEQYVTADQDSAEPDINVPVNTNAAFSSVVRSCLGSHSLVYAAEVDCEDPACQKGNKYIELKTSRLIESDRQQENFCRFKLIKWWAQSFLIGIPRVICGFRDDNGVVRQLKEFVVQDMPHLAKSCVRRPWNPAVCFNFLDSFLNFVKSNIKEDNERCVYLVRWQPSSDVIMEKRGDDPQFHFLPDWFINWEAWDTPCTV